ncbi:transcriptional regulator [Staphylococcus cohnii subsp. cohnii]|uniref:AraC family transcriptional regulator n=1 Tax=Staphylococcus TaxID=1279 RepID=UPI0006193CC7|nr:MULTISPECIES: AraC family transcriptional regulator [unclassified Staphylococcus]KKD24844.1 transcriptional regulator [Staphylococcus cohnii subsp. cohnii]KKD25399.1 transcriptional regulator [Staphylococcus cohnii subsp. cohnii]
MYQEIIVENTREELIQFPDKQWKHIILHTHLNRTIFGYIPIHWHHALQFMYVVNGTLDVSIGDDTFNIKKGDGLFINSNVVHELTSEFSQTEYYCWNIEIPETINYLEFNHVSEIINKAHYVPYIYLSQDDKQQRELLEIINSAGQIYEKQNSYFELDITAKYYKAIKWLLLHFAVVNEQKRYYFDYRIKRLITYLQNHFHKKISLQMLSDEIHMSKSETVRCFKFYVNQTPMQYLVNLRLEHSVRMLRSKQSYTITDIAMACGFSTTSYFIKVFKEKYKLTPKQFQKKQITATS